ncbi:unnamed protein product [Prorocentrum cordatum]|uniref:Uncharacterized protein n=1 Tax=Prorocentrum cordatum TaxID=2364126 RepID=A0ABN9VZ26_9DINO|nr:unnamed protein product [Polarella glacialis]
MVRTPINESSGNVEYTFLRQGRQDGREKPLKDALAASAEAINDGFPPDALEARRSASSSSGGSISPTRTGAPGRTGRPAAGRRWRRRLLRVLSATGRPRAGLIRGNDAPPIVAPRFRSAGPAATRAGSSEADPRYIEPVFF